MPLFLALLSHVQSRTIDAMKTDGNESKADHWQRLHHLTDLERRLEHLRERECELEVDCITADAAVKHGRLEHFKSMDVNAAAAIVLSLDRKRVLEAQLESSEPGTEDRTANLRVAGDALQAWLAAGDAAPGLPPAVRAGLALASLAAVCAALVVHLAFLVLLIPIGATMAMMWSGNDTSWSRLGAKRRFEQTGLPAPAEWTTSAVSERLTGLQTSIDSVSTDLAAGQEQDVGQLNVDLEQVSQELATLLAAAGLGEKALDAGSERDLRLISGSYIARHELEQVKVSLASIGAESEAIRSDLYRYLARHGVGPFEGQADVQTLVAGLKQLETQAGGEDSS